MIIAPPIFSGPGFTRMAALSLMVMSGLALVRADDARADTAIYADDALPLFCRDGTGTDQPFLRTNMGLFRASMVENYGFFSTVYSRNDGSYYIVFSKTGEPSSKEDVIIDMIRHEGGFSFVKMKIETKEMNESRTGNEMCWTAFGFLHPSP